MYRLTSKLIVYRTIGQDSILYRMGDICHRFHDGDYQKEELVSDILDQVNRLLDVATRYGFNNNLWHNYLAYLLATTEVPFSLVAEKVGASEGSVTEFAKNDLVIFKQLFDYDFSLMEEELGINCFTIIENYSAVVKKERIFNKSVSEKVQFLSRRIEESKDADELYCVVTDFYRDYGVGKLGLNKAFRIVDRGLDASVLEPITATGDQHLADLVGYELQKKQLVENTEAFVAGRPANNVLLYGDAGTGKSTSVKAILNEYYDQGLRMIEIYKHDFKYLARVVNEIKNRNYRFIIFMDDLSFDEGEIEYKYLKAIIEGGLETKPDNVLIYATSNRRHLIRESWSDRNQESQDDDMHRNDTVQEKLSLAARFGCQIGYFKPSQRDYFEIVKSLAARNPAIQMSEQDLLNGARAFELQHGGFSGRVAQQYINSLAGANES
ncbi:MAG: ATP-binding protein [Lachnospiraceae bacterium]|nr:ATP-binding protein [Lachnospiraceae bacterium]